MPAIARSTWNCVINRPWLPEAVRERLTKAHIILAEFMFARQGTGVVHLGGIGIRMPARHPLPGILKTEPFREQLLRAAASVVT